MTLHEGGDFPKYEPKCECGSYIYRGSVGITPSFFWSCRDCGNIYKLAVLSSDEIDLHHRGRRWAELSDEEKDQYLQDVKTVTEGETL